MRGLLSATPRSTYLSRSFISVGLNRFGDTSICAFASSTRTPIVFTFGEFDRAFQGLCPTNCSFPSSDDRCSKTPMIIPGYSLQNYQAASRPRIFAIRKHKVYGGRRTSRISAVAQPQCYPGCFYGFKTQPEFQPRDARGSLNRSILKSSVWKLTPACTRVRRLLCRSSCMLQKHVFAMRCSAFLKAMTSNSSHPGLSLLV
jgi:hypothetical protein